MSTFASKDRLYNSIIEAIQENAEEMDIGLVRAILAEVDGEIARGIGRLPMKNIASRLKKRMPHE